MRTHTQHPERPAKNFQTQVVKTYQYVHKGSTPFWGEQLFWDGGGDISKMEAGEEEYGGLRCVS